jgi:hypothetical protein
MPTKAIMFGAIQESGDEQLAGASPLAINVLTDGKGTVRRRPGISAWMTGDATGSPVLAISSFGPRIYFICENRRLYATVGGSTADLSSPTGVTLAGFNRPVFAVTPWHLVATGGGRPIRTDKVFLDARPLGGSPPPAASIVSLNQRLITDDLGLDAEGHIRFSSPGKAGNEEWDELNFTSAEARPDAIVAIRENGSELFAFGTTSLQVFSPDPVAIFAPGRAIQRGIAAADSVVTVNDTLSWFSEQREFVTTDGRTVQALSDPIAATLDAIETVDDCFGFHWNADQFSALVWKFPTDGRTFVAQGGKGWAQWHGWEDGRGHTPFPVTAHYYWPEENRHLVGLADGSVAQLDTAATTDLGATIKAEVTTGFINHDTDSWKSCDMVRLTFRRGQTATGSEEPHVMLSWRDTLGGFCAPLRLGLGTTGDYVFTVERRSLGMYRARQWKLEFTGAADFVLARVEETYSMGGNN